jgi:hypothetical protein
MLRIGSGRSILTKPPERNALPYVAAGAEKRMVAAAFWGFGIGGTAAGELVAIS